MSTANQRLSPSGTTSANAPGQLPSRILVVGEAELAERIAQFRGGPSGCAEVPGFLAAMGHLATQPADVVIGSARSLTGMAGATARALRQLAPQARLLLLVDPDWEDQAEVALAEGFNEALPARPDDAALRRSLNLPAVENVEPAFDEEPAAANLPPELPPELSDFADLSTLDLTLGGGLLPREFAAADRPDSDENPQPCPGPAPAPGESGADGLQDTDLIRHLLRGRGGLRGLALRLIRDRTGSTALNFVEPDAPVPAHHAVAAVQYQSQSFGQLHAPAPCTADTLEQWAAWLGTWLRLEHQIAQLRDLSMKDELTGVYNRRYFNRFLQRILEAAAETRQQVTLLVFDIDDFKHYNDAYGHAAGDEILREVASLIRGSVREHDVVARIGGDEFAVIFWDAGQPRKPHSRHPDDVRNAAQRFQRAIIDHRFPKLMDEAAGNLTVSGGLAGFPWDGRSPEELLEFADTMALRSKRQGKNAITFGPHLQPGDDPADASP